MVILDSCEYRIVDQLVEAPSEVLLLFPQREESLDIIFLEEELSVDRNFFSSLIYQDFYTIFVIFEMAFDFIYKKTRVIVRLHINQHTPCLTT